MPAELALPPQSFALEPDYANVLDVRFVSQALTMGARSIRGARWSTQEIFPADSPEVIATAYYEYRRAFEALVMIEDVLVHLIRSGDTVTVRMAGDSQDMVQMAEAQLRRRLPEVEGNSPTRVAIDFAHWSDRAGVILTSRMTSVPTLADIEHNYSQAVRSGLEWLARGFDPDAAGRLLLWHGLPGCGKTWALRALASEWRDWCTLRYVTDPETFLREPSYLINLLHMRPSGRARDDAWTLIVLEDTGELMTNDAKQKTGQGLSRLLNVVDGLLGESANVLILVTTNEDMRAIHPAIARPGRCAQLLEFGPLSVDEANIWLAGAESSERVATPATLAELFAVRAGTDMRATRRRSPGFV